MKRKSKLLLSLISLCFSVAMLCFGVYSAMSVSFTISGDITYQVDNAFAEITTKVYAQDELMNEAQLRNMVTENRLEDLDFASIDNILSEPVQNFDTYNSLTNTGSNHISGVNIDYDKHYSYFVIINIKNLSQDNFLNVTLENNVTGDEINSYVFQSDNVVDIVLDSNSQNGRNMIFGYSLKDPTIDIDENIDIIVNVVPSLTSSMPTTAQDDKFVYTAIPFSTNYEVALRPDISRDFTGQTVEIPSKYNNVTVTKIASGVAPFELIAGTKISSSELGFFNYGISLYGSAQAFVDLLLQMGVPYQIDMQSFWDIKADTIIIPDSVTTIGTYSFVGSSFNNISFGKNVKYIDYDAFVHTCWGSSDGQYQVLHLTLPDSIISIGENAFVLKSYFDVEIGENIQLFYPTSFMMSETINDKGAVSSGINQTFAIPLDITVSPNNKFYTSRLNNKETHFVLEKSDLSTIYSGSLAIGNTIEQNIDTIGENALAGFGFTPNQFVSGLTQQNFPTSFYIPDNTIVQNGAFGTSFNASYFELLSIGNNVSFYGDEGEIRSGGMYIKKLLIIGVAKFKTFTIGDGNDFDEMKIKSVEVTSYSGNEEIIDYLITYVFPLGPTNYSLETVIVPSQEVATLQAKYESLFESSDYDGSTPQFIGY